MRIRLGLATLALAVCAAVAWADVPPFGGPRPRPTPPVPVPPPIERPPAPARQVRVVLLPAPANDPQPRLRLSKALVDDLRDPPPVSVPPSIGPPPGAAGPRPVGMAPGAAPMLAAALALTAAAVTGGLWISRGGRRRLAGGLGLLLAGIVVVGVCGCPREPLPEQDHPAQTLGPLAQRPGGILAGEALLESREQSDEVQVLLGPDDIARLTALAAQAPAPPQPQP
jgi:hypothetical protein